MNRLSAFLRSVIPADPFQLIYLIGIVFLTITPRLGWFPLNNRELAYAGFSNTQIESLLSIKWVLVSASYPIIFAGMAGYLVCFWPGPRAVRRLALAVCLPTVIALVSIFVALAWLGSTHASVLASRSAQMHDFLATSTLLLKISSSMHFCLLGLFLIVTFVIRVALGVSKLPVSLSDSGPGDERELSYRATALIFLLVGPLYLIAAFPFSLVFLFVNKSSILGSLVVIVSSLQGLLALLIALWVVAEEGRRQVAQYLRTVNLKYLVIALVMGNAVSALIPLSRYLADRAHWAAFDYGRYGAPRLDEYFRTPGIWVLSGIVAAIVEEIIFRGYFQTKLINKYGMVRGLFVNGIIWSAIHFRSDPYLRGSDSGVLVWLAFRIFICLVLSYVLGWFAIKSGSVYPSMIIHGMYNLSYSVVFELRVFPWKVIIVLLWAVAGAFLFRKWPPTSEGQPTSNLEFEANSAD